jgi:hypothetical protein
VNPKDFSSVAAFLPFPLCSVSTPTASITTTHMTSIPARAPEEKPEPPDPPHGEGSGELLIFTGLNASGMITNVHAQSVSVSWEPPDHAHPRSDLPYSRPISHIKLNISPVTPRRPLPRARRSC